ncbi:MAG TPA: Asp-tRNA(Asn)/Glu-tRNA(Gln) amidotransferase subunit GatC [Longimicrobiales bacterium]|nr:Asp-tRNA(Asn)/Glu-tRNA(Gln) amidotransferase subunit GatC [Longimicrobiales bacterium]
MAVTREQVLHVATLARLRLSPDEVERFTGQLNDILEHFGELASADLAGIAAEPATSWPSPMRPDTAPPDPLALPPSALAPAWEAGFFTVPRLAALDTSEQVELFEAPPGSPAAAPSLPRGGA